MQRTIMPTYEYQCPDGHVFEKFQKMSDKPRASCPVCGKTATRKISGGAGLVFKGSGFYITDYGKDGKGPRKEKTEKSEKAEKTEKTESKPPAAETSKKADAGTPKSVPGKGKAPSE
jgi:putative FmdB family regulatory protein